MGFSRWADGQIHWDMSGLMGSPSPINIAVGGRTIGKSFSSIYVAVKHFIHAGNQTGLVFRYDSDIDQYIKKPKHLDIQECGYFSDVQFKSAGTSIYMRRRKKDKWKHFIECFSLNKYEEYKKSSYPGFTKLIFDEFIREQGGGYLSHEPDRLISLWSTVTRRSDRCRVYMLANNTTLSNPYFVEWGITLPGLGKTRTYPVGQSSVTVERCYSPEFSAETANDPVSKFIAGSARERIDRLNTFMETGQPYKQKPSSATFSHTFTFGGRSVGVWVGRSGEWYVSRKTLPGRDFILMSADWAPTSVLLKRGSDVLRMLDRRVRTGNLWYDCPESKVIMQSYIDKLGIV